LLGFDPRHALREELVGLQRGEAALAGENGLRLLSLDEHATVLERGVWPEIRRADAREVRAVVEVQRRLPRVRRLVLLTVDRVVELGVPAGLRGLNVSTRLPRWQVPGRLAREGIPLRSRRNRGRGVVDRVFLEAVEDRRV